MTNALRIINMLVRNFQNNQTETFSKVKVINVGSIKDKWLT